jgi:hypothetical protein
LPVYVEVVQAAAAVAFFFLRQPSNPKTPRPDANSGSAAAVVGLLDR